MNEAWIVHICRAGAWEKARIEGHYQPPSLTTDGFIHFSLPTQVLATANRFYAGERDLLLLWVPVGAVGLDLRWEPADGEVFPHLYRALHPEEVWAVTPLLPDASGVFMVLPAHPD
jgi:uncharacterized protein (DUF952 family)